MIASNRPDGQPVSVATWYLLEDDGRILVNMDESRRRLHYLRHDPRVSLTVIAQPNWGTHVSVQGTVEDLSPDPDLDGIDRLCRHYTGNPVSGPGPRAGERPDRDRVLARLAD